MSKNQNKQSQSSLWIYGKHPVFEALAKNRRKIFKILLNQSCVKDFSEFAKKNNLNNLNDKIKIVDNNYFDLTLGKNQTHQGFAINCSYLPIKSENDLFDEIAKEKSTILIMDQLTDPHNIGAIIRSAIAFGVKNIVFPENNFAKENAAMIKSSSGMIENAQLFKVVNLSKLMERLKKYDYWCVGLDGEAKYDLCEVKKFENIALVIGSEGDGIRPLVKKNCDLLVKIAINSQVESLNASVACALAMYEISKNKPKIA